MKPIPKELQAYFPKAADPARPWWNTGAFSNGIPTLPEWRRAGDAAFWSNPSTTDRAEIDKADPIPPPPILVGQVWGVLGPDNATIVVFTILSVITQHGGPLTARGTERTWFDTQLWGSGFLLSCPYGHAPWSGPEVVP